MSEGFFILEAMEFEEFLQKDASELAKHKAEIIRENNIIFLRRDLFDLLSISFGWGSSVNYRVSDGFGKIDDREKDYMDFNQKTDAQREFLRSIPIVIRNLEKHKDTLQILRVI
jgi:hypothetical protein